MSGVSQLLRARAYTSPDKLLNEAADLIDYLEAQDGLLSKAQDEAERLLAELAEVKRPLDAQMPRLNANLTAANERIADLESEHETRSDGVRARKDRWETGIRRIVALLWGNRHPFEIDEVVERVRILLHKPNNNDDEAIVRSVLER
jgi:DNA repair ATPase RecN